MADYTLYKRIVEFLKNQHTRRSLSRIHTADWLKRLRDMFVRWFLRNSPIQCVAVYLEFSPFNEIIVGRRHKRTFKVNFSIENVLISKKIWLKFLLRLVIYHSFIKYFDAFKLLHRNTNDAYRITLRCCFILFSLLLYFYIRRKIFNGQPTWNFWLYLLKDVWK